MMPIPTTSDDCDDCTPAYLRPKFNVRAAFSTLPFLATFALVTFFAYRRVHPLLQGTRPRQDGKGLPLPATAQEPATQSLIRRIAALTFSSTIALSTVLTELLLCEISNSFNPTARTVALQITVISLLGLLVIAIPLLGIHTVVAKAGPRPKSERLQLRLQWSLEAAGYALFLVIFWALGVLLPAPTTIESMASGLNLFQACLDRLGITGVTLMALLSGFASVSAIWQTFGPKARIASESDITRKQAGLDATLDMIAEKKSLLDNLSLKLDSVPAQGFWSKTVSSFRGNADAQEKQTLEMEINGLETMASSLDSSLSVLRTRLFEQQRRTSPIGRAYTILNFSFACYCVYRIITTTLNLTRRLFTTSSTTKPDTDPVTTLIALFARHIYPSLDQAAWAQQISFLLSGAMLLLSFSAVTQTFHLFARFMPSVLHATRTNFALLISQISGMYVISSALMLRGMMPEKVGSVINSALGSGLLEPVWVQKWFDGWFMMAVVTTAAGIFLSRQLGGGGVLDDDGGGGWDRGGHDLGKRS